MNVDKKPTPTAKRQDLLTPRKASDIQNAARRGKKTIVVDGIKLALTRQTRRVTFVSGGKTVKRRETWVIAKPADGTLLPVYSVELTNNLRSKHA